MKYVKSMVVCAAVLFSQAVAFGIERIDNLLGQTAPSTVTASARVPDTVSENGVTKRRLGTLTKYDMVVTDVDGGAGGPTNAYSVVTNYDAKVIVPRERMAKPVRLGPYLWETGTEGEDFTAATNRFAKRYPSYAGGCTGVCNNRYHGRNLDWTYDRGATVVVRSPAKDGKLGVIGVSTGVMTDDLLASNVWDGAYYALPFSLCDGINDHGVVIQQNVLQKDVSKSSDWHTNRTGCVIAFAIIRYTLDRCTNALQAAEMIRDKTFIPDEFAYDFHFQVSDRTSSYIVEDGHIYTKDDIPTDVMTNFRNGTASYMTDGRVVWDTVETYGIGLERYDNVRTNGYDKGTVSGMAETMRALWYTKTYETNTVPFWYTEYCTPDKPDLTVMNAQTNHVVFTNEVDRWYKDYIAEHDTAGPRYRGGKTWQTSHMSIYDKNALKLILVTQEDVLSQRFFYIHDNAERGSDEAVSDLKVRTEKLETWQGAVSNDLLLASADGGIKRSVYFSTTNEQLTSTVDSRFTKTNEAFKAAVESVSPSTVALSSVTNSAGGSVSAADVSAIPDSYVGMTNNANFKAAVEAVSPPVVLPEKWALANVTNAEGKAVSAADVTAIPDSFVGMTNNANFKSAVEAVSPPVVLPEKWALANVTNAEGNAVSAADVTAIPDNFVAMTNNANFKSAVEAVSPPVVLPEKWALANVTNVEGNAVAAADVSAVPDNFVAMTNNANFRSAVSSLIPDNVPLSSVTNAAGGSVSAADVGALPDNEDALAALASFSNASYRVNRFTKNIRATANIGIHKVDTSKGYVELELKGKTIEDGLQYIMAEKKAPSAPTYPAITEISLPGAGAKEVGTYFTPSYTVKANAGTYTFDGTTGVSYDECVVFDAHNDKTNRVTGTSAAALTSKTGLTGSLNRFVIKDTTLYRVYAKAHHTQGNLQHDNQGNVDTNENLRIASRWCQNKTTEAAATKYQNSTQVSGYRPWYTYAGTSSAAVDTYFVTNTAAKVMSGSVAYSAKSLPDKYTVIIPAGSTRAMVAIPAYDAAYGYTKTLTDVIHVNGMGLSVKDNFVKTTVSITVAGIARTYNVWTYDKPDGFPSPDPEFAFYFGAGSAASAVDGRLKVSAMADASTPSYQNSAALLVNLQRTAPNPLDATSVFYSMEDLTYYVTTGRVTTGVSPYWLGYKPYPYSGQIVTLAIPGESPVDYILSENESGEFDKDMVATSSYVEEGLSEKVDASIIGTTSLPFSGDRYIQVYHTNDIQSISMSNPGIVGIYKVVYNYTFDLSRRSVEVPIVSTNAAKTTITASNDLIHVTIGLRPVFPRPTWKHIYFTGESRIYDGLEFREFSTGFSSFIRDTGTVDNSRKLGGKDPSYYASVEYVDSHGPADYANVSNRAMSALQVGDILDDVTSTATDKALSANRGRDLQEQINNLKQRGRYLSIWNAITGAAMTLPPENPYTYKAGDYFVVGYVTNTVNYRPDGATYETNTPSRVVETDANIKVNDTYYYDGDEWSLQSTEQKSITISSVIGLQDALEGTNSWKNGGNITGSLSINNEPVATSNTVESILDRKHYLAYVPDVSNEYTAVTIGTRYGSDKKPFGKYSFTRGQENYADGEYSFADGLHAGASCDLSYAFGHCSYAQAEFSTAIGYFVYAMEQGSFVWRPYYSGIKSGYFSNGEGTFNISPKGGFSGFYVGDQNLQDTVFPYTVNGIDYGEWQIGPSQVTIRPYRGTGTKKFVSGSIKSIESDDYGYDFTIVGTVDGVECECYLWTGNMYTPEGVRTTTALTNVESTVIVGGTDPYKFPVVNGILVRTATPHRVYTGVVVDSVPTTGSTKLVASGGVKSALEDVRGEIAGKYELPEGGIATNDLSSDVRQSLLSADTAYQKPESGIPESDLSVAFTNKIAGISTNVNMIYSSDRTTAVGGDLSLHDSVATKWTCSYGEAYTYKQVFRDDGSTYWKGFSYSSEGPRETDLEYGYRPAFAYNAWRARIYIPGYDPYDFYEAGSPDDTVIRFGGPIGTLTKEDDVGTLRRHGKIVPSYRKINGKPLTDDITITDGVPTNVIEDIAASVFAKSNSVLRPPAIRVVHGNDEHIINADMQYETAVLVPNGLFREIRYVPLLGRYVTNELTWIAQYEGWGNPMIRPADVRVYKEGDQYSYVSPEGYTGGYPVSFSGEWQAMPYYYRGDYPPSLKGTNYLQYVWRTNVTFQAIATSNMVEDIIAAHGGGGGAHDKANANIVYDHRFEANSVTCYSTSDRMSGTTNVYNGTSPRTFTVGPDWVEFTEPGASASVHAMVEEPIEPGSVVRMYTNKMTVSYGPYVSTYPVTHTKYGPYYDVTTANNAARLEGYEANDFFREIAKTKESINDINNGLVWIRMTNQINSSGIKGLNGIVKAQETQISNMNVRIGKRTSYEAYDLLRQKAPSMRITAENGIGFYVLCTDGTYHDIRDTLKTGRDPYGRMWPVMYYDMTNLYGRTFTTNYLSATFGPSVAWTNNLIPSASNIGHSIDTVCGGFGYPKCYGRTAQVRELLCDILYRDTSVWRDDSAAVSNSDNTVVFSGLKMASDSDRTYAYRAHTAVSQLDYEYRNGPAFGIPVADVATAVLRDDATVTLSDNRLYSIDVTNTVSSFKIGYRFDAVDPVNPKSASRQAVVQCHGNTTLIVDYSNSDRYVGKRTFSLEKGYYVVTIARIGCSELGISTYCTRVSPISGGVPVTDVSTGNATLVGTVNSVIDNRIPALRDVTDAEAYADVYTLWASEGIPSGFKARDAQPSYGVGGWSWVLTNGIYAATFRDRLSLASATDLSLSFTTNGTTYAFTATRDHVVTDGDTFVTSDYVDAKRRFTKNVRATADIGVHEVDPNTGYVELDLAGKTLDEGIAYLTAENKAPEAPVYPEIESVEIVGAGPKEVGSSFTPSYVVKANTGLYTYDGPNNGVTYDKFVIYDGSGHSSTTTGAGLERRGNFVPFTVTDTTEYRVYAKAHHTQGNLQHDNQGHVNTNEALRIASRWCKNKATEASATVYSNVVAVTGYRPWYTYSGSSQAAIDSAFLTTVATKHADGAGAKSLPAVFNIPVSQSGAHTKRVLVAIPAYNVSYGYTKSVSDIRDVGGLDVSIIGSFTATNVTVTVPGAAPMTYSVLYYDFPLGFAATSFDVYFGGADANVAALSVTSLSVDPVQPKYKSSVPLLSNMYRQYGNPLDSSSVFYSAADLDYYVTTGRVSAGISDYWRGRAAYPYDGQIVTLSAPGCVATNYMLRAKGNGEFRTDRMLFEDDAVPVVAGTNIVVSKIAPYTNYRYLDADGAWHYAKERLTNEFEGASLVYASYRDPSCAIVDGELRVVKMPAMGTMVYWYGVGATVGIKIPTGVYADPISDRREQVLVSVDTDGSPLATSNRVEAIVGAKGYMTSADIAHKTDCGYTPCYTYSCNGLVCYSAYDSIGLVTNVTYKGVTVPNFETNTMWYAKTGTQIQFHYIKVPGLGDTAFYANLSRNATDWNGTRMVTDRDILKIYNPSIPLDVPGTVFVLDESGSQPKAQTRAGVPLSADMVGAVVNPAYTTGTGESYLRRNGSTYSWARLNLFTETKDISFTNEPPSNPGADFKWAMFDTREEGVLQSGESIVRLSLRMPPSGVPTDNARKFLLWSNDPSGSGGHDDTHNKILAISDNVVFLKNGASNWVDLEYSKGVPFPSGKRLIIMGWDQNGTWESVSNLTWSTAVSSMKLCRGYYRNQGSDRTKHGNQIYNTGISYGWRLDAHVKYATDTFSGVKDVMVNGESVVTNGVADITIQTGDRITSGTNTITAVGEWIVTTNTTTHAAVTNRLVHTVRDLPELSDDPTWRELSAAVIAIRKLLITPQD